VSDPVLLDLTRAQLTLLGDMATAMRSGVVELVITPDSDVVNETFAETFQNFLLLHHAIYRGPLNKEAFEFVFAAASEAAGRTALRNRSRGSATHDIRVDDVKWSLKTEAGVGLSSKRLYVAKWMEGRWIRECTNPAECAAAMTRVVSHMDDYDRVIALQAIIAKDERSTLYRLIEVPKGHVQRLTDLGHEHFTKPGSRRSYGANLPIDPEAGPVDRPGERLLRILLDSSVEKVRMWFEVDTCRIHATWQVEHEPPAEPED
jgi:hypothetical protein